MDDAKTRKREWFRAKMKHLGVERLFIFFALLLLIIIMFSNILRVRGEVMIMLIALFFAIITLLIGRCFVRRHSNPLDSQLLLFLGLLSGVALLIRFSFMLLEISPLSDAGTFFGAATTFMHESNFGIYTNYISNFPYLFPYDYLLGMVSKITSNVQIAFIMLNTFLDISSAFLLYILVKKIAGSRYAGALAVTLWLINPINIFFSVIPLPVTAVNTFIILTMLVLYYVTVNYDNFKKLIPLSVLAGLILCVSNSFRPIFPVFIIALVLYQLIILLKNFNKRQCLSMFLSTIVIVSIFIIGTGVFYRLVSSEIKLPVNANSGGWSIYVGSNINSWGQWNEEDASYFSEIISRESSYDRAHEIIKEKGIERYKTYDISSLFSLFVKKILVLAGDQMHAASSLDSYPAYNINGSQLKFLVQLSSAFFMFILTICSMLYLLSTLKGQLPSNSYYTFIIITMLGLFAASLLVEVSNRYFSIFMPFLTILTASFVRWLYYKKTTV